jgi:hypothetical protein
MLSAISRVDSSLSEAGRISCIRDYLWSEIEAMNGSDYQIRGKSVSAKGLQDALKFTLRLTLEAEHMSADRRRGELNKRLGLGAPQSTIRRDYSPERDVRRLLAKHLVERARD